ncbi:MAG: vitamin K epoxide reductase family protein [Actinomycetota bacterium]
MVRRRSTPWIHRWSRIIIASLAAIGILETAYLTVAKFMGASVICPTSGCDKVLNSPYAIVFGVIPLSLLGFFAYLSMGAMALGPLAVSPETNKRLRSQLEKWTWLGIFLLATAMPIFSGYLMYLMIFEIKDLCVYCVTSAVLSVSLFVLSLIGHEWEDIGQLLFTGIVVGMVTLIAALGIYNTTGKAPVATAGNAPPPVATLSGPSEIALARHLKQIGAKEYGAFWCPHCHDQKELFGNEASTLLNYIECDPSGQNAQPQVCQAANIKGYPTWEINGQIYSGVKPLEELAQISGYSGPRNFKNSLPR